MTGRLTWLAVALIFVELSSVPGSVHAQATAQFDIPAQPLGDSLRAIASQTNTNVLFEQADVAGRMAPAVRAQLSISEALDLLLKGTGLVPHVIDHRTITLVSGTAGRSSAPGFQRNSMPRSGDERAVNLASITSRVASQSSDSSEQLAPAERSKELQIEEVVVSATKRAENIEDIPLSITALTGETIARRSLVGMSDYLSTVPGVTQSDITVGDNKVVIRGIAASAIEDSTVGVYFGEVPLTDLASGSSTDIKLVDIERVEVLRGPQGTLYGAGSMGGTIRNIPVPANLNEFQGSVEVGYSQTVGEPNTKTVAVLNVPVVPDKFAVRIAAYNFSNTGYVDNVGASDPARAALAEETGALVVDQQHVGDSDFLGVRLQALYQPTQDLSLTLTYVYQDLSQQGDNTVDTDLPGRYQAIPFHIGNYNGGVEDRLDIVKFPNLVIDYDLGWGSIMSSTTWLEGTNDFFTDVSRIIPLPLAQSFDSGRKRFTQEVRVLSDFNGPLQVLGGVYYENASRFIDSHIRWVGAAETQPDFLGAEPDDVFDSFVDYELKQTAVFGEATFDVNEQFAVTLGGRSFEYDRREDNVQQGALTGGTPIETHPTTDEGGQSYKANLTYTPHEDHMFYAQWAEGFRLGVPVTPAPAAVCDTNSDGLLDGTLVPTDPGDTRSDTLDSYEVGAKLRFLDRRLAVNMSAYRIEWDGIPVLVVSEPNCGFGVQYNAGHARSQGLELETTFQFAKGLRLEVGAAYVNAELSSASPLLEGSKGTPLPGSAEYSGNVALEYEFQLAGHDSFARADYAYVGPYFNDLAQNLPKSGDYSKVGVRAGIRVNEVSMEIYGTNLTNSDALTLVSFPKFAYRLAPRTIGFALGYQF